MSGSDKLREGSDAPVIELIDQQGVNLLEKNNFGKYRLINFWSPKNPASRISNVEFNRFVKENENSDIEFISICIDKDESLMKEVMKVDGIQGTENISFSQLSSRVLKDYDVENSPKSLLISPDGKILKFSPSVSVLGQYL